jgi:hypothetical protein
VEDLEEKQRQLDSLRERVKALESELEQPPDSWPPEGFYAAYYATTGFMLGAFGAMASLLFNVVGSLVVQQPPFRLIQVYLTFPLGARALEIDDGLTLALGCCLYLATGMIYGALFQVALSRITPQASFAQRLALASMLAITVWAVNFYGILSWLQPLLFGGDWIIRLVPVWVGALTHLVFGWTMVLVYPLGVYIPYRVEADRE